MLQSFKKYIEMKSLKKVFEEIKNINSLVVKPHPKFKSINMFSKIDKIPDYYPVEMCYHNIKKNVISVFSTSLIIASQIEHLKAISLLEMVKWHNNEYKEFMKNFLTSKSKSIIFPKNLAEFHKAINS